MATFKTRARAVDMLGRQQIAGVPNAISELFKNAHDAYADHAEVDYFLSDGLFILRDDGIGMTREEFEERWLTLGTESKLGAQYGMKPPPKDPEKALRPISGEKGIGRLAIAAIGPQVLVLTRAGRGKKRHDLVAAFIHWGLFELAGVNLDEIEIPVKEFTGGSIPSRCDLKGMIDQVRSNLAEFGARMDPSIVQRIHSELESFDFDPGELAVFLTKINNRLGLDADGRGTHFYIKPTVETLKEDIRLDAEEKEEISRLRRLLLGFSDTMTSEDVPTMRTAFRYWQPDDSSSKDIIDAPEFWEPEDLERADHHFTGSFDEFGQFQGTVRVFDHKPTEYVLPSLSSKGEPTACGRFRVDIAYLQGRQAQSRLSPDEWVDLNRKLRRIGGMYVYRDGIRMLPYGDVDYDWLEIEKRRNLGASYYFFSYRRMVGAIFVSRRANHKLQEKAGREGFRENKAYRELRRILIHFLVQLAADFFRSGGEQAEQYERSKEELTQRRRALQEAKQRGRRERQRFERKLDTIFDRFASGEPQKETNRIIDNVKDELDRRIERGSFDTFDYSFLDVETGAIQELNQLRASCAIDHPEDVGLTQQLGRDWMAYLDEFDQLDKSVLKPAEKQVQLLVVNAAQQAQVVIDRQKRLEELLRITVESSIDEVNIAAQETKKELERVHRRVIHLVQQITDETQNITERMKSDVNLLEFDTIPATELEEWRLGWANQIEDKTSKNKGVLAFVRAQLREIDWDFMDGFLISTAEMRAALEEEVLALQDEAEVCLELSQLGMAIEIIDHEFNNTIRAIRSSIYDLKSWADANAKLYPLYRNLRNNFEHLDSYLNLFTPLHRRLYRQAIDISGRSIAKFLGDLFEERLKRDSIEMLVSSSFEDKTLVGYPSTMYPVFVNLVDNSTFWLKDRPEPREIHLDADEKGFIVWDTGPGIPLRDMEAVFEMGFTRKPGGRGLGLYIARQVLEREGFRLDLDRPVDGRGATFRIAISDRSEGENE